jgi:Domain of unknown function (DUF397)
MDKFGLNWRKSSRSNANGSECVEVAQVDRDDRRPQDAR